MTDLSLFLVNFSDATTNTYETIFPPLHFIKIVLPVPTLGP